MARCKITVLRLMFNEDLAKEYAKEVGVCPQFEEGQVFTSDGVKPEGFCEEAWTAIGKYVFTFSSGGGGFFKGNWMKDEKVMIACCNDGVRPVVFKLERIDG